MFFRHKLYNFLSKTVLLLVYLSFFSVQSFFNFSSSNNDNTSIVNIENLNQAPAQTAGLKKIPIPNQKKLGVRLNKRFKTASAPVIAACNFHLPFCFLLKSKINSSSDDFISSEIFLIQSLRGPPVVC